MKLFKARLKPKSGFAHFLHLFFMVLIPFLVYVFVQWNFVPLALAIILLSKWRTLAVRPRHWWPNIRANAVDIVVGISILVFMVLSSTDAWQLIWAVVYAAWLLLLKPRSDMLSVTAQALVGQTAGLTALWLGWGDRPTIVLIIGTWLVTYVAARHFFTSFDEPHSPLFAHTWAYFSSAVAWILGHWLLFYGLVPQPALLLSVLGFGLGGLYYLENFDRLSVLLRRQIIFIMVAIILVVLAFSSWGDKTI